MTPPGLPSRRPRSSRPRAYPHAFLTERCRSLCYRSGPSRTTGASCSLATGRQHEAPFSHSSSAGCWPDPQMRPCRRAPLPDRRDDDLPERLRRSARRSTATQGNDLMAARGAPVVAVEAGKVRIYRGSSSSAGCMLYFYGDSGTVYYYIHLNDDLTKRDDNRARNCRLGVAYAKGLQEQHARPRRGADRLRRQLRRRARDLAASPLRASPEGRPRRLAVQVAEAGVAPALRDRAEREPGAASRSSERSSPSRTRPGSASPSSASTSPTAGAASRRRAR